MGRRSTVQRLAKSRGVDAQELLLLLRDSGVDVESVRTQLVPHQLRAVRRALRSAALLDADVEPEPQTLDPRFELSWPEVDFEPRQSLTVEDVLHVHDEIALAFAGTDDAVDPPGVKDVGALESALTRPETGHEFGQHKYASVQLAASALLHSIIGNHAFYNGNKRTALIAYVWFLRLNGHYLLFSERVLYEHVVAVASHALVDPTLPSWMRSDAEVLAIHEWTKRYTRAPSLGDRLIDWRRLERLLRKHGAEISTPRRNKVDITLGDRRAQFALPRRGRQIKPGTVAKIRSALELDEGHGCDSLVFYEGEERPKDAVSLIKRYSTVLRKLSEYDRGAVLVESDHHDWVRR